MKKIISYILVILWMILIFYLSSQNGSVSSTSSSGILNNILNLLNKIFTFDKETVLSIIHGPMRELMHSFEYFILAILIVNLLKQYNLHNIILITVMISFIYSVSDEIHQLFVIGRTFEYFDIMMDFIGIIVGSFIGNKIIKNKIYER